MARTCSVSLRETAPTSPQAGKLAEGAPGQAQREVYRPGCGRRERRTRNPGAWRARGSGGCSRLAGITSPSATCTAAPGPARLAVRASPCLTRRPDSLGLAAAPHGRTAGQLMPDREDRGPGGDPAEGERGRTALYSVLEGGGGAQRGRGDPASQAGASGRGSRSGAMTSRPIEPRASYRSWPSWPRGSTAR